MTSSQSTEVSTLSEVRRIVVERAEKKKELDALDRALESIVGLSGHDRPQKPRLSSSDIRNACLKKQ